MFPLRRAALNYAVISMASKHPGKDVSDSAQPGKRRQNLVVAACLALVAIATWHSGRSGGGVCLSGACMIPDFARAEGFALPKADRLQTESHDNFDLAGVRMGDRK